jgi:adenine-specific DNA-methyltransferase
MESLFDKELVIHDTYHEAAELILHLGDAHDFVADLPSDSVQLILTSPPYNLGKSYETQVSIERYLQTQASLIRQLVRVLRPGGSVCWQVGNFVQEGEIFPLDIYFYPLFKAEGLRLRNRIIWHFGHGLHATKRFSGRYETLLWFTKGEPYVFNLDAVRVPSKYPGKRHYKGSKKGQPSGNPNGKNPSDIWEILLEDWESGLWDIPNVKSNHTEKTEHPCQFPIELVERCVLALSHEGDLVFDPYVGVGSTLIGACRHQRRAMGCEKEATYVAIAEDRLRRWANGTLKTRAIGQPVHQPTGREKVAQKPLEWQTQEDET